MENKGVLLTYHYREVAQDKREKLVTRAKEIIIENGFKVKDNIGNKIIRETYTRLTSCSFCFRLVWPIVLWSVSPK